MIPPRLMRTLVITTMIMSPLCLFLHFTQLGINMTPSLPYKLFLTFKGSSFKKGDLVTISGHPTRYYPSVYFTKYVKGISEDKITKQHQKLYLNNEEIGPLHSCTIEGHPLTPQKTKVIPKDMLFLAASHERSFDSRYQEFGLVPVHKVVGRTVVLW